MRIGIDARFYGAIQQGLGRYSEQLVVNLAEIGSQHTFYVFILQDSVIASLPDNFKVIRVPYAWYGISEQTIWPFLLYRYRLDLMHFPHFNVPVLYRHPYVVTIHDLILLHRPSAHATTLQPWLFRLKHLIYRWIISNAVRHAKKVITVTEYSKRDILNHWPRINNKVVVIAEGGSIKTDAVVQQSDQKIQTLPEKYLLYVGNAYPHKNLDFIIETYQEWSYHHPEYQLVLVGTEDYFYRRLRQFVRDRSICGVRFWGRASDSELQELYRHAAAYVFPSLHEGFGLPPLEAMSQGTPVLSSNRTCLPEVLGDAALYFDPENKAECMEKLSKIVSDHALREQLKTRGLVRSSMYSWKTMAREIQTLYDSSKS